MYPPQQNVSNDTPQGNSDYHKLIINDESRESQLINHHIICSLINTNYNKITNNLISNNLINNPFYNNSSFPHHEQLNNQNDGQNSGQNKRFGVWVTSIWTIQSLIDYILVLYVGIYAIPYQFGIVCIFLMFLIPIIVFKFNENQLAVSVIVFFAFIIASIGTSRGLIYILDGYYQFFITFQYYQIGTMTVAFIYLLNTHKKPEFKQLMKLMTLVLIYCMINYLYVMGFMGFDRFFIDLLLNILIWAICCSFLCYNLANTLNGVYTGQNKKIQRNNIWTGYILFKLYFFIPGV